MSARVPTLTHDTPWHIIAQANRALTRSSVTSGPFRMLWSCSNTPPCRRHHLTHFLLIIQNPPSSNFPCAAAYGASMSAVLAMDKTEAALARWRLRMYVLVDRKRLPLGRGTIQVCDVQLSSAPYKQQPVHPSHGFQDGKQTDRLCR